MLQFFETPLNVGMNRNKTTGATPVPIPEVVDNNYETSTTSNAIDCNIDKNGNPRNFSHIFVKCSGAASIKIDSGSPTSIPEKVVNDSALLELDGNMKPVIPHRYVPNTSITINGKQNYLHKLSTPGNALKVKITLTPKSGESVRIYQLYVLNEQLNIADPKYDYVGLTQDEDDLLPSGRTEKLETENVFVSALGNPRDKRSKKYRARERAIRSDIDFQFVNDLELFYMKNKNFTVGAEVTRFPNRLYRATWDGQLAIRWNGNWKGAGRNVSFTILER